MKFPRLISTVLIWIGAVGAFANANTCEDQFKSITPLYKDTPTGRVLASADAYSQALKIFAALPHPQESEVAASEASLRTDFATAYPRYVMQNMGCPVVRLNLARILMTEAEANSLHRHEVGAAVLTMLVQTKRPSFLEVAVDGLIFEEANRRQLLAQSNPDAEQVRAVRKELRQTQADWIQDFKKMGPIQNIFASTKSADEMTAALRQLPDLNAARDLELREIDFVKQEQSKISELAGRAQVP